LKKSLEANKLKFSMISDIGNLNNNNNEDSPKRNLYTLNDNNTYNNEKSRFINLDENSNENLKEITMLMKQILEE
jgi:hypothetical protein